MIEDHDDVGVIEACDGAEFVAERFPEEQMNISWL